MIQFADDMERQAPGLLGVPPELVPALVAALQRRAAALDELGRARVELENVRLRILLDANVDRPELYQLDLAATPPVLVRAPAGRLLPGASAPVENPTDAPPRANAGGA